VEWRCGLERGKVDGLRDRATRNGYLLPHVADTPISPRCSRELQKLSVEAKDMLLMCMCDNTHALHFARLRM